MILSQTTVEFFAVVVRAPTSVGTSLLGHLCKILLRKVEGAALDESFGRGGFEWQVHHLDDRVDFSWQAKHININVDVVNS